MTRLIKINAVYRKTNPDGWLVCHGGAFLVEADSREEAEKEIKRRTGDAAAFTNFEKEVTICGVFDNPGKEQCFLVHAYYVRYDKKNMIAYRDPASYIVLADDWGEAASHFKNCMEGTLDPVRIEGLEKVDMLYLKH